MKYLNSQKYSECLLVTAINAAIYLGEPYIDPSGEEYERLVDLVRARNGSALNIEKAYEYLRLDYEDCSPTLDFIKKSLKNHRPVGVCVRHRKVGFHSVLVLDYKRSQIMVANLSFATKDMWISWKKFKDYIYFGKNITSTVGKFRSFFLVNGYKEKEVKTLTVKEICRKLMTKIDFDITTDIKKGVL